MASSIQLVSCLLVLFGLWRRLWIMLWKSSVEGVQDDPPVLLALLFGASLQDVRV
jgi:hypothetical protein